MEPGSVKCTVIAALGTWIWAGLCCGLGPFHAWTTGYLHSYRGETSRWWAHCDPKDTLDNWWRTRLRLLRELHIALVNGFGGRLVTITWTLVDVMTPSSHEETPANIPRSLMWRRTWEKVQIRWLLLWLKHTSPRTCITATSFVFGQGYSHPDFRTGTWKSWMFVNDNPFPTRTPASKPHPLGHKSTLPGYLHSSRVDSTVTNMSLGMGHLWKAYDQYFRWQPGSEPVCL